jgi:NAD(P)H-flavin reductase/16S rRNA G966 N2-methylase RsmD
MENLKTHLEREPEEITSPIVSHPYGEKFTTSLYRMHKYWGRKPSNVVAEYIKRYCPENEIVLDPFVGSGTTAIEAIRHRRKVIGLDINPLAVFITQTTLQPVRLVSLEATFRTILNELFPEIAPWYETRCSKCGKRAFISYVVYVGENDRDLSDEAPIQIFYRCTCATAVQAREPDDSDRALLEATRRIEVVDWYPDDLKLPQSRGETREARGIRDLYTRRNLYSLAKMYSKISQHSSGTVRDCLLLAFSSSLPLCSRLCGVDKRKGTLAAMGWILTSFRIMKQHIERNPLEVFCSAFQRVLKGKVEANAELSTYSPAETANDVFHGKATALILQASVEELGNLLNGNQVKYVFTDPPHGPSLQYMKLSTLSNAWLKMPLSSENEIIQERSSKASERDYAGRLRSGFESIREILCEKAKVHVYFRTKKEQDWLNAAGTILGAGFKLVRSVFQPQRYSFRTSFRGRAGDTTQTAHPGDRLLHLKPDDKSSGLELDIPAAEKQIIEEAEFILRERGQPTRLNDILMYVASKVSSEVLKKDPELIVTTLEKYVGDRFIREKLTESFGGINGLWSLAGTDDTSHKLDSRVEKAIVKALIGREDAGSSKSYVYQAIYSQFCSELTPDQTTIENALSRVAVVEKRGRDRKLYLNDEYLDKREIHSELVLSLVKIGLEHRFEIYVSPRAVHRIEESEFKRDWSEILEKYETRVLLNPNLISLDARTKLANVLWLKVPDVHAHFEVEDRAGINEMIFQRGDEVRRQWPGSERVLVVPHKTMERVSKTLKSKNSFWHLAPYHKVLRTSDPTTYQPFERGEMYSSAEARPLKLRIVSKEDIRDSKNEVVAFKLKLRCPSDVLKRARPGHFLMVEINKWSRQYLCKYPAGNSYGMLKNSPIRNIERLEFLRIPLSIHRIYYKHFEPDSFKHRSRDFLPHVFWEWVQPGEREYLDLLIRLVGHGTRCLNKLREGDILNVIGPLGREIEFPRDFEDAILVSGGVGLASLYPVAHHLRERGYRVILFAGSRDKRTLQSKSGEILPDFAEMGVECHITDEVNQKRFVTDLVREWLGSKKERTSFEKCRIYSCGPWLMLKEVHKIALRWNIPCTVLVDKLMLCGVGACMSCVVRTRDTSYSPNDASTLRYRMVRSCVDGPSFDSRDVVWD